MTKTNKPLTRPQACRETIKELHSYGVPAERIVPIMNVTRHILAMGDGMLWSQIDDVIKDVYEIEKIYSEEET
jgi:hypothetical protein